MNTEITKHKDVGWLAGWVLYDGDCVFCRRQARRFEQILTRRGFDLAPLQAPWVQECLGLEVGEPMTEMKVLTPDGRLWGGAEAVIFLARQIWWAWPLYALSLVPGVKRLLRAGYRWVARRRHCLGGACRVSNSAHGSGWNTNQP